MDESGTPHNRRSQRSNLLMTAMLEVAGKTLTVKLRNLSPEGARVEGEQLPVEGTELVFRKGDLSTAARVVWIKGRQAGIGFEQKLDPDDILNHVTVPRPRVQPDFRRPGLGSRELTPSERAMAERWIVIPPTVIE